MSSNGDVGMPMGRLGKLSATHTALFVCDIQERNRPLIAGMPSVIDTASRLLRGAKILNLPVVVSEHQYDVLGETVSELKQLLDGCNSTKIVKTEFSMVVAEVEQWLQRQADITQVVLCGVEAHSCLFQTALDLLEKGYEVHVVADGTSSQRPYDRSIGLHRMSQSGALLCTSEMALFQLVQGSKHPHFKDISNLIIEPRCDYLGIPGHMGAAPI